MGVTVKNFQADDPTIWQSAPVASPRISPPDSGESGCKFRHTVSLIRGTSHRFSLFEVRVEGLSIERTAALVRAQFDSEAQVEVVDRGTARASVWLMFVRTGGGDRVLESRVRTTLVAALQKAGLSDISFRIEAAHRDARMMVDLDDLTEELRASRIETPAGIFH